ncbi:MAG: PD40 domain-containing protein [Prevotella sp.]|nr:PD40 domain-containing protein [Prevotella sp.]
MSKHWILFVILTLTMVSCGVSVPEHATPVNRLAKVYPDNHDAVLPPNIAPMNFNILEQGDEFITHIFSEVDQEGIVCAGSTVMIPEDDWNVLLTSAKGKHVFTDIYVKTGGEWQLYQSIKNRVAMEDVDPYITYRLIPPSYEGYGHLSICQRNVTNFDERVIYDNLFYDNEENGQCINCHVPQDYNRKGRSQFHVRQEKGGTVFIDRDHVKKVDLKTENTLSAGVYPAWHPKKNLVAYSVNKTYQVFHTMDVQKIEVMDFASDLILYDVEANKVYDIDNAPNEFESFPSWSADGNTLYFVSANVNVEGDSLVERLVSDYQALRYNIYSRSFDESTMTFGEKKMVFDAAAIDKSAAFPRLSPDGRYLLFSMADYGQFHIWHHSSDLMMIDLNTNALIDLKKANSSLTESYHSWSSNGRWILFSSRREDGNYTRLYMAYFDKNGHVHHPFVLPQKDPETNHRLTVSYNVPEWMVNPVKPTVGEVAHSIGQEAMPAQYGGTSIKDGEVRKPNMQVMKNNLKNALPY